MVARIYSVKVSGGGVDDAEVSRGGQPLEYRCGSAVEEWGCCGRGRAGEVGVWGVEI